jgi:hypothetical protein
VSDLDRPRSAGELIRDMFALFARDWATYLIIGCVVVVPVYLAVFGLGLGELTARFDGSPTQGREFLEGGVLFAIVLPLVMVMVARVLSAEATAGQAIQGGLERFAAALVVAVAAIAFTMAGLFLLILPGIYVAIRLALAVPAAALEDLGPLAALRRSWALSGSQHLWRVLGLMALVLLLTGVLEAVIEIPLAGLAKAIDRQGVALAGNIISYAITLPIAAIGAALVFFDLRARQSA